MTRKGIYLFLISVFIIVGLGFGVREAYIRMKPAEYVAVKQTSPTLPSVSFEVEGYVVNELLPYTREMDISAAREWLTPLDANGKAHVLINDYGNEIKEVHYEVYTLDGQKLLISGPAVLEDNRVSLDLDVASTDTVESALVIQVNFGDSVAYFYSRIIGYDQLMLEENIEFVKNMHSATLDIEEWEYLDSILDNVVEAGNANLQNINMESSIEEIQWSGLNPTVIGEMAWRISESSSVYSGIELSYMVEIETDDSLDYFWVEEYYRTSYISSKELVQLNDYKRTATQIYQSQSSDVEYKKLKIGVNGDDLDIIVSEDQNIIVFSQGKELFTYNSSENRLTKVYGDYSWVNNEELDARDFINQYEVKSLDVDNNGNVSFAVIGYVNRGENEGLVGTSIYYYDEKEGITTEKAFICGDKSYSQSKEELYSSTYYNIENKEIYLMINQIIYAIDLETMVKRQISQILHENEYVFSEDREYIAFNSGEGNVLSQLTVLSIESGQEYNIKARDGEYIYPLGFLSTDLVVGYARADDALYNYRGELITPSYEVEVRSEENEIIKSYSKDNHFVEDVVIDGLVIYLNQVMEIDQEYAMTTGEYIANNISTQNSSVEIINGVDDTFGAIKYISLKNTTKSDFTYEESQAVSNDGKVIIAYETETYDQVYNVYAYGKLYKSCKNLVEAITLADTHYGYVLNSNQGYVWRRGARALNYPNSNIEGDVKAKILAGSSVVEVIQEYTSNNLQNYTGLSLEAICYLINQDHVIGFELQNGSGGIFVGYTIDTMYYIDDNGTRRSMNLVKLSSQIDTMMGNSNLH